MNNKEFMNGIGKRVDEILSNTRLLRNVHIEIDAKMDEAPIITYTVEEVAKGYDEVNK